MILSHKHRFIFIKTNKTAGTSIEIALSKFCGPRDIITPIEARDEAIRQQLGYRGPANYHAPLVEYRVGDLKNLLRLERKQKFYNHIGATKIRGFIGESIWNSYYKFCFERNPWERVISQYYFRYQKEPRPTILEHLRSPAIKQLKTWGIGNYTIDGKVVVDKVCRYEEIKTELEAVRALLQLPEGINLPNAKGDTRKDKRNYRDVLTTEEASLIADLFRDEIAMFGYRY